jgi:hypothetical protein
MDKEAIQQSIDIIDAATKIKDDIKNLPKDMRDILLYWLFVDGTVDYVNASNMYVRALQAQKHDRDMLLSEADTIICEDLLDREGHRQTKSHKEFVNKHIHRALYFMNQRKTYRMEGLNETFGYDEEKDKELSWYEREKSGDC